MPPMPKKTLKVFPRAAPPRPAPTALDQAQAVIASGIAKPANGVRFDYSRGTAQPLKADVASKVAAIERSKPR